MSQTHVLVATDGVLLKRYTSWKRDEHRREWTLLNHLYAHVPGLVPRPVRADLDAHPPSITMTELPGKPLSGPLGDEQLAELARALDELWCVPADGLPLRRYHPLEARDAARSFFAAATRPEGVAGHAFDAAVAELRDPAVPSVGEFIVGHGDPCLANYLWDGHRVRVVDFEDAGRSDRAYELGCLIEHISAHDTDWTSVLDRFDVDRDRLRRSRILFASLWLYWLLPGNAAAKRNPPAMLERQAARVLALSS